MALDYYQTSPFGSLARHGGENDGWYIHWILHSPQGIQDMLFSRQTGAFIQGLAKRSSLPMEEASPKLAFAVLRVAVGEVTLTELASVLAADLKLSNDKAKAMAKEVEKELFVPHMLEFTQWQKLLHQKAEDWLKKWEGARAQGGQNAADLKNPPEKTKA
ncbi:MAG: hypothetical protein AAB538_01605 [Patescibacteria group bacterium]